MSRARKEPAKIAVERSETRYFTARMEAVASLAKAEADRIYRREFGLSIRQVRVLRRIGENPGASVSEITKSAMLERTLVSRLITQLAKSGHVIRHVGTNDARQVFVNLTARGEELMHKANLVGDELNADLIATLDPKEWETLNTCLDKLARWHPERTTKA